MLDATNEMADIKKELLPAEKYGYDTPKEFDVDLAKAMETAIRERMLPALEDQAVYDYITTVGKANFTEEQNNIYYAEIFYVIAEFFLLLDRWDKQSRLGLGGSDSQGGVSRSISGYSGKEAMAEEYLEKAEACISRGGYYPKRTLKPRSSIHA